MRAVRVVRRQNRLRDTLSLNRLVVSESSCPLTACWNVSNVLFSRE